MMTPLDLLALDDWKKMERQVAGWFGLGVSAVEPGSVLLRLLEEETQKAEAFTLEDVHALFVEEPEVLRSFGIRWYADCIDHDYGEEWNPEEGNQQEDMPPGKTVGMSGGFLMGYAFLLLYARHKPELLQGYIKARRIPAAVKVTRDVKRVYAATLAGRKGK